MDFIKTHSNSEAKMRMMGMSEQFHYTDGMGKLYADWLLFFLTILRTYVE